MISTFGRLETLLRGLQAQQRAVDVTNHNVANANTPGFSRQAAILATTPPYTVPTFNRSPQAGQVGTGVSVDVIQRMRAGFLDLQYRAQADKLGFAGAQAEGYAQLEAIFHEPSPTGINATLDSFWQAWHALVNRPDDPAVRAALVEDATRLATAINQVRQQIDAQRLSTRQTIALDVEQVNNLARRIADLNRQITGVLGSGQQPNDLLDQRDLLLDQLSRLVGTTNVTTPDGAVNVYLAGQPLVERIEFRPITMTVDAGTGEIALTWQDDGGPVAASSGSIAGLIDVHDRILPQVASEVLAFRDALVDQVNAQHRTGYGLNDPAGSPPNRDFFEVLPNGDVRVLPAIVADPSLIAASSAAETPGNGENALAIANLRLELSMSGGSATINGFYQALLARIGSESQQAQYMQANQETLVHTIDRRRQEVSAVSLDEEATNLVKYQHAYQAAARAMTVVDEMLDRLINGTGVVGR